MNGFKVTDMNFQQNPSTLSQWNAHPAVFNDCQSFVTKYLYNMGRKKILLGIDKSVRHFHFLRKLIPCISRYFVEKVVISAEQPTEECPVKNT